MFLSKLNEIYAPEKRFWWVMRKSESSLRLIDVEVEDAIAEFVFREIVQIYSPLHESPTTHIPYLGMYLR